MRTKVLYFLVDPHLTNRNPRSRIDDYKETCLRKFSFVCNEAAREKALLILSGDVFHTPIQLVSFANEVTYIIRHSGVRAVVIPGNHDVVSYNFARIKDTSLGSLIVSGVVPLLKSIKVGVWQIVAHKYGEPVVDLSPDPGCNLIVVSHSFFGNTFGDKMNITKEEVEELDARLLLLGHDHTQYPPHKIAGTTIVRPGSMTRATSHTCNYSRIPSFARIVLDVDSPKFKLSYKEIPHLAAEEVYTMANETVESSIDSFDDVRSLIESIRTSGGSTSPFEVLDAMGLSAEVHSRCEDYMHHVGIFRNAQEAIDLTE